MKVLKKILIVLVVVVALAFIVSLFLPSKVTVERTAIIDASSEMVFEEVNTLKNWDKWDPWNKIDANMKQTYEGEMGAGSKRCWESEDPKVGKGCLTIVESRPSEYIATELVFDQEGNGNGEWKFEATEEGTKVVWAMHMDMGNNPIGKFFGLMMDGMIGPMFEEGLISLKGVAESKPEPTPEMATDEMMESDSTSMMNDSTMIEEVEESVES